MPPILFTRPTHEWISRVNQRHQQLAALGLSDSQREQLDRRLEIEFVHSTLSLEGINVNREEVERLASAPPGEAVNLPREAAIMTLLQSIRSLTGLARDRGRGAALTVDLLLKLHNVPGEAQALRSGAGDTTGPVKPVAVENLPAVLESACYWYSADSFAELHPVEQASIVFLRLLEIQPFEQGNERTALLAASLFTLRSNLPPIIITHEKHSAYRNALEEGSRMNTKPMVELIAEAVASSIEGLLREAQRLK